MRWFQIKQVPQLTAAFRRVIWRLGALGALALSVTGCAGDNEAGVTRLPVVPVKGQVLIDGKPGEGAFVVFHATKSREAAGSGPVPSPQAYVQADGSFVLTTYEGSDGAPVGEYAVTVELRKSGKDANGDWIAGDNKLPERFAKVSDTPLKLNVTAGGELPPFKLQTK